MQLKEEEKILLFLKHYSERKKAVYNFALRMLNDAEKAADITQTVFLKLFENLEKIREEEKIPVWIFVAARNEIFADYRARGKNLLVDFEDEENETADLQEENSLAEEIELKDLREVILSELQNISPLSREIFLLREYGGLSYKEISEATGEKLETVKSRLFKTRKKLIRKISKIV